MRIWGFAVAAVTAVTAGLGLGSGGAEAQQSRAAAWLADQQIAAACDGRGGRFDPSGLIERDLTGDGRRDLVLSHEAITCAPGGSNRSLFCGMQVCTVQIYVREGDLLQLKEDFLGGGVTVGGGDRPVISGYGHGGGAWSVRWDGQGFR